MLDKKKIATTEKLVEFTDEFKVPTTFDIVDHHIHFVINTQLDNFGENLN